MVLSKVSSDDIAHEVRADKNPTRAIDVHHIPLRPSRSKQVEFVQANSDEPDTYLQLHPVLRCTKPSGMELQNK